MRVPMKATVAVLAACTVVVAAPGPGAGAAVPAQRAAAATSATSTSGTATAAADSACSDVLVLAVPGNRQGPTPTRPWSAGATLDRFVAAFGERSTADRRTVSTTVIAADTASVRTLAPRRSGARPAAAVVTPDRVRAWRGASWQLAGQVQNGVLTAAERCPGQQLVLAGYSQGAMAVHRALLGLAGRPAVLRRVSSVVLVGDGDRRRWTAAPWIVGAPRALRSGQGVVPRYLQAVGDVPTGPMPAALWQVCTRGDLVCDLSRVHFGDAVARHQGYSSGTGGERVSAVGRAAWERTTRWPLPDPVTTTVPATAGEPVGTVQADGQRGVQLGVRVRAGDLSSVQWRDATGLPTGLGLTKSGLLTGTVATAGTYVVDYTVENTAAAVRGLVRGRVVVEVAAATTSPAADVSAGGAQSCAIGSDGVLSCWGANPYGQLGDGTTTARRYPRAVGTATDWSAVSTGGSTTCGVRASGLAFCWGLNQWGQLGDGTRTKRLSPVRVAGGSWESVSAGWFHTCGVKTDGSAWCWGSNDSGQLGDGTLTQRLTPVRVAGGGTWREISVGGFDTCGVKQDGTAWCWGRSMFGELAVSGYVSKSSPQRIGAASDWLTVQASWNHTCGLRSGGAAYCWGKNDRGQRGDASRSDTATVTPVAGEHRFTTISVGDTHTCAVDRTSSLWCWGYNRYGQFGDGASRDALVPVAAAGALTWRSFDAGWLHGCGITTGGAAKCWGSNIDGQLGNGTVADRAVPTDLYRGDLT